MAFGAHIATSRGADSSDFQVSPARTVRRTMAGSSALVLWLLSTSASAGEVSPATGATGGERPVVENGRSASAKDSDGDGVLDSQDKCPTRPETWNKSKDDDGCPEYDTDGDGLLDGQDKCPSQPENWNGYKDDDGCPELDTDGDGRIDPLDQCPTQPETFNGVKDEDGCPDGSASGTASTDAPPHGATGAHATTAKAAASRSQAPSGATASGGTAPAAPVASGSASGAAPAASAGAQEAPPPSTTGMDEALLKELEAATAPLTPDTRSGALIPLPSAEARPASSGSAFSNVYNPAMSVNGLFLARAISAPEAEASARTDVQEEEEEASSGVGIQEVELQLLSNVDPYFSANLILAMDGGSGLEVEEGHITLTPQPFNLAFRFGKLKVPFGRENALHTHALPFIDKSLVGQTILGEEGLGEVGVEVSYLMPLPFYSLIYGAVLNGDNENVFGSPNGLELAYFGGLKNLFDVTDDATLEVGLSYAAGQNADLELSQVAGAHLIFKWKPASNATRRSAVAVIEALYAHRPTPDVSVAPLPVDSAGAYAYLQWQLAQRWYVAGRYDFLGMPSDFAAATQKGSLVLTLAPTEFSAIRLEGSATQPPGGIAPTYEGLLQFNFTLGAHPAHAY